MTTYQPAEVSGYREAYPALYAVPHIAGQQIANHFVSGVAVITSTQFGRPIGFTVDAFHIVSQEPMIITFTINQQSASWSCIQNSETFCLNTLTAQQGALSEIFAREGGTRFQATRQYHTVSGIPTLAGAMAWFECSLANSYPVGDSLIILADVRHIQINEQHKDHAPLVRYKGQFGTFLAQ